MAAHGKDGFLCINTGISEWQDLSGEVRRGGRIKSTSRHLETTQRLETTHANIDSLYIQRIDQKWAAKIN